MADNFAFTAGTGSTGAADDIGGVLYPRVKMIVGADGTNDGDVCTANPMPMAPYPTTSGGLSVANFNTGDGFTALTNSAQVIKAGAGQLYGFDIYNPNVTAVYVMFYNVAAASVTVGTTGALKVICIPAGSAITKNMTHGIAFGTAMSIACATTGGGNTAPTTALEASVEYK